MQEFCQKNLVNFLSQLDAKVFLYDLLNENQASLENLCKRFVDAFYSHLVDFCNLILKSFQIA